MSVIFAISSEHSNYLANGGSIFNMKTVLGLVVMPPTLKKLVWHIVFGLSVHSFVHHTFLCLL